MIRPNPTKSRYAAEPYDGEIAYMDSAVGKLLRELKTRGLYDGAMIAIMADHGESLGAHGEDTHGFFLYDETINVPLVIKLPHARAAEKPIGGQTIKGQSIKDGQTKDGQTEDRQIYGRRIDDRVGLVDVMPTMLQTAGIAVPAEVQGESLLGFDDNDDQRGSRAIRGGCEFLAQPGGLCGVGLSSHRFRMECAAVAADRKILVCAGAEAGTV